VTAAGKLVGPVPLAGGSFGIGFRGNKLYAWDVGAQVVRELNPATGASVGVTNIALAVPATWEGDITFRSDGIGFLVGGNGGANNLLYSFDITVPSSTPIPGMPANPFLGGLAFDPASVLYALADDGTKLYTINQATGALTLVGNTTLAIPGINCEGLAFDASGKLFAALSVGAGPSSLYSLNPATGVATLIGPIGFGGIGGLSFVPAAAPKPGNPGNGEGTYVGSSGPPAGVLPPGEGDFSFGGGMKLTPSPPRRFPVLRGPIPGGERGFLVFNVAHQQATAPGDLDTGFPWAPLGCVSIAVLALGLIANRIAKYRAV
jgi:hypothetical protein